MVSQAERLAKLETTSGYIKERLDDFIESADSKYASKTTEKIVYSLVGIMLTGIVIAIVGGVVNALS